MEKILIASNNQHKIEEISAILLPFGYEITTLKDINVEIDVEETGKTFADNAILKVEALREYWDYDILADDSGIEFECLNGLPGIYSARFLGENTPYEIKNELILRMMQKQGDRRGRYVCCIAFLRNDEVHTFEAYLNGTIANVAKGEYGFGYDPIFFLPKLACNLAELPPEEKNKISHRSQALLMLEEFLENE